MWVAELRETEPQSNGALPIQVSHSLALGSLSLHRADVPGRAVYVRAADSAVAVSESLPELLAWGLLPKPDVQLTAAFLNSNRVPAHLTCWQGIARLLPGATLEITANGTCFDGNIGPCDSPAPDVLGPTDWSSRLRLSNAQGRLRAVLADEVATSVREAEPGATNAAIEVSGGLKSSALLVAARDAVGRRQRIRGVATSTGFRHGIQILETADYFDVDLARLPVPPSDPGRPRSWPRRAQLGVEAEASTWERVFAEAVTALADPFFHWNAAPLLRFEQAASAGVRTLLAGNDLGLASGFVRQSRPHPAGSRWTPPRIVSGAARRMASLREHARRARLPDPRLHPLWLIRPEVSETLPRPHMPLADSAAPSDGTPSDPAPRLEESRWRWRDLEDQTTMAAELGVRLVSPLTSPSMAALLRPEVQPQARLLLRESLGLNHVFDWPARRFPPHGPP